MAITPEEHAQVEQTIKAQPLSLKQKMVLIQNFRNSSVIPTPQDVPETGDMIKVYRRTQKKQPQY
jgi:hypothetical protein